MASALNAKNVLWLFIRCFALPPASFARTFPHQRTTRELHIQKSELSMDMSPSNHRLSVPIPRRFGRFGAMSSKERAGGAELPSYLKVVKQPVLLECRDV